MGSIYFMNRRARVGQYGESLAARYLQKRGYTILDQNWRTRFGEIDIIARRDQTIYFFEVKTRGSHRYGHPFAAVTPFKQYKVRRAGAAYIATHPQATAYNFVVGVIGVSPESIECITNIAV